MKATLHWVWLAFLTLVPSWAESQDTLVVHEWGTFTSLQDEDGGAIGGINTDDEPVPSFVHHLAQNLLLSRTEAPAYFSKGAPRCHPDVTMRLETPVLYFHPPQGKPLPAFNVHVSFRGGWLTEFYPNADVKAPGLAADEPERLPETDGNPIPAFGVRVSFGDGWLTELHSNADVKASGLAADEPDKLPAFGKVFHVGHLKRETVGELTWTGLSLGGYCQLPDTDEKVWLSPRAVQSAAVRTPKGENEKYLFYRGVGNVDASLRVVRNASTKTLSIFGNEHDLSMVNAGANFRVPAWLLDILPNGRCAFRILSPLEFDARVMVPDSFAARDFSQKNMPLLRDDMRRELVKAGLFADEADALLNTWQASYFQSPGLRLFYLCPRVITDSLLPLSISIPCKITRVMIGRIEIVTPDQRALLKEIAADPAAPERIEWWRRKPADQPEFLRHPENVAEEALGGFSTPPFWQDVMEGKKSIRFLGLDIPDVYLEYLKLGRFRNALILDEEKRHPTKELEAFIAQNELKGYNMAYRNSDE